MFAFQAGVGRPGGMAQHLDPRGRGAQARDVGLSEESIGYWQTVTFLHLLFAGTRWGSPSPPARCSRHLNIPCTAGPTALMAFTRLKRFKEWQFWGGKWWKQTCSGPDSSRTTGQVWEERGIIKSDESALTSPFIQAFPPF